MTKPRTVFRGPAIVQDSSSIWGPFLRQYSWQERGHLSVRGPHRTYVNARTCAGVPIQARTAWNQRSVWKPHTSEDTCTHRSVRGPERTHLNPRTSTGVPIQRCHTNEDQLTSEDTHTRFLDSKWILTSNWWPLHTSLCEDLRVCHTNEDQVTSEDSFENTVHLRTHTRFYRQPRTRVCLYKRQCEYMSSDGHCFIYGTFSYMLLNNRNWQLQYAEAYSSKNK